MLNLKALEAFVWAAKLGQFRLAAQRLHLTQPAVSTRVQQLEQALGTTLFERQPQKIVLTVAGGRLLPYAEQMLELCQTMRMMANQRAAVSGPLRLGVSDTIVHTWLPDFLTALNREFPLLVPEIHVDIKAALLKGLVARQLDLIFIVTPVDEQGLHVVPLVNYPLTWVASPQLGLNGPVTLAHIAQWPVLTHVRNSRAFNAVKSLFAGDRISNYRIYTSASVTATVSMARSGIGVGVVPDCVIRDALAVGALQRLHVSQGELPVYRFVAVFGDGPDHGVETEVAALAQQAARAFERKTGASDG